MFFGVYLQIKFNMSKNLFLPSWQNVVDNTLVESIINHLESDLIHAFKLKLGRENLRNGKYPKGFSEYFNLL